jgi:uncharacterized protein (DUF1015 family)
MVEVRPFRGIRYNPRLIPRLGDVLSPPYDVISPEEQLALHTRSPYNVIRLEWGLAQAGAHDAGDVYLRAAQYLEAWLREGVLMREERPAFYLHEHVFSLQGAQRRRLGLWAAVRLHAWEEHIVRPHEETTPRPVDDRLRLLRATRTNISPVFGLYKDERGALAALLHRAARERPTLEAETDGARHRLWAITEPAVHEEVRRALGASAIYIADGHHRYTAALAYREERSAAAAGTTGQEAWRYVLMSLTALEDPGLAILPLHRLLRLPTEAQRQALAGALASFSLEERRVEGPRGEIARAIVDELARRGQEGPSFALWGWTPGRVLFLRPRTEAVRAPHGPPPLDSVLLQQLVLGNVYASAQAATDARDLAYTPWAEEALQAVERGEYALAFLLNPVPPRTLTAYADAGERFPPKTTYFYPKVPTGLVLHPLD